MRNTILISFLIILFSACTKEESCNTVFTSVDVSFSNTWTMKMSINIDSSRTAHVLIDSLYKGKTFYIGTINDSAFCIINSLIGSALKEKYDNVIGEQAPDASVSGIEIATKNKKFQTLLLSSHSDNILDTIIRQMSILNNYTLIKETASNFNFSSYDIITPKMEEVKFIPPIIKADTIEK